MVESDAAEDRLYGQIPNGNGTTSDLWIPELVLAVAKHLPPNVVACTLRMVNKATYNLFRNSRKISFSQHVPEPAFARHFTSPESLRPFGRRQRLQLLVQTARSGSLANLKLLCALMGRYLTGEEVDPDDPDGGVWAAMSLHDQVDDLQLIINASAERGHGQSCRWMLQSSSSLINAGAEGAAACAAARGGYVRHMHELLPQLQSGGAEAFVPSLLAAAADGCSLAVLQGLYGEPYMAMDSSSVIPKQLADILAAAAASATSEWRAKAEWLEGQGYLPCSEATTQVAARCTADGVDRLTWLQSRGYPVCEEACLEAAAGSGNMSVLQHLMNGRTSLEDNLCKRMATAAARNGHLAVLQMLHARGVLSNGDDDFMWSTLPGAFLEVYHWLAEAFPVDERDLQFLAEGALIYSNLPALRWMHERGSFQPVEDMVVWATHCDCSEELLVWLVERGCLVQALRFGHVPNLALLRCMHRLGWRPDGQDLESILVSAARRRLSGATLSWLRDMGCPSLQQRPDVEMFRAWRRKRYSGCSLRWLMAAAGCPVRGRAVEREFDTWLLTQGHGDDEEAQMNWLRGRLSVAKDGIET